jgi:hypothetical protein
MFRRIFIMKKREIIIYSILLIIILIMTALLYIEKNKKTVYLSQTYVDNDIYFINKDENINVSYNLYNQAKKLGLIITNNNKTISDMTININFKDYKGNILSTEEKTVEFINVDESYAYFVEVPSLIDSSTYAGEISIELKPTYLENNKYDFQKNDLKLTLETNNEDIYNPTYKIIGKNTYNQKLNILSGAFIFYKNNKIVNMGYFNQNNIDIDADINADTIIGQVLDSDNNIITDYDDYKIIIDYIN